MRNKRATEQIRNRPTTDRTGGKSVYSYYNTYSGTRGAGATPEKSIDLGAKTKHLRMLPTIIACLVIVGSILFSLTLSSRPAVSFVPSDELSPYRNEDEYIRKAQELLESSIRHRLKLSVDTDVIEHQLIEAYPEIAAAQLRLPILGRKPTLFLDIREPAMVLATNTKSFILDKSGTAVAEMRQIPTHMRQTLLVLQDESNLATEVGKQAVTSGTVQFILALQAQLAAKEVKVSQLTLPAVANELDIHIEGHTYYLKTDTSGDARLQAGSFLAVKEHLEKQGITPSEYIDVRVEEKVFYR